jgi:hypothetical protein
LACEAFWVRRFASGETIRTRLKGGMGGLENQQ